MSKKHPITSIDFDFGVGAIIPATQEAYHCDDLDEHVRKVEKEGLIQFSV